MYLFNELHIRLYAEDRIRARLLEAENYRMLNQLRKKHRKMDHRAIHLFLGWLGRSLISLGERLERHEFSSVS